MQNITSANELQKVIRQLESDQNRQAELLKSQFASTVDCLKPKRLITSALKDFLSSPVVMLFGIEKLKSLGHLLIDKFFRKVEPITEPDEEPV